MSTSREPSADPLSLALALDVGKKPKPHAMNLLMQDHREVLGLFDAYERTADAAKRSDIAARICMDLLVHMKFEEEYFYAAAEDGLGDEGPVEDAIEEHDEARTIIQRLQGRTQVDDAFTEDVRALRSAIVQHVTVEETDLFSKVQETGLDEYEIGAAMAARRAELFAERTRKPLPQEAAAAPLDLDAFLRAA